MKIGINDGCANGGMMDSLEISPMEEEPGWQPYAITEVTEEEWAAWQVFIKEHNKWEKFWETRLIRDKAPKNKPAPEGQKESV